MDKEVSTILMKYLKKGVIIDDLQSELTNARCVIYHPELPPMNGQSIHFIDASPDKDYPMRILQAYRQMDDCKWVEGTDGSEPTNPLLIAMNEQCNKRAELLDKAISILQNIQNKTLYLPKG